MGEMHLGVLALSLMAFVSWAWVEVELILRKRRKPVRAADWKHVAQLELECFGEIRSPQALAAWQELTGPHGGLSSPEDVLLTGTLTLDALPQGRRPLGPFRRYSKIPNMMYQGSSYSLPSWADPREHLDPNYEWVQVDKLGSDRKHYIRGQRKWPLERDDSRTMPVPTPKMDALFKRMYDDWEPDEVQR